MDKGGEDGAGEGAVIVGALGVPLNSDDEVLAGGELDGFDDVVLGGTGGDDEVVAGGADGLMVAGIDVDSERG